LRLQKAASGLLSFFELKVDGGNPDNFSNTVVPTVEVAEFYAAAIQSVAIANGNVQNPGDAIVAAVPAGSAWRVRGVGFDLTLAAATTGLDGAGGSIFYDPGSGGGVLYEAHSIQKITAANAWRMSGGTVFPRPFVALPGTRILYVNDRVYSVASPVNLRVFFDPIAYP
jgi:hypothetical protein